MTPCDYDFKTTTHAKWILAGEHAVTRGHAALVFPFFNNSLTITYKKQASSIDVTYTGKYGTELRKLFWQLLEYSLDLLKNKDLKLHGYLLLSNTIPPGTGLGASAALAIAITRWLAAQNFIASAAIYSFAKQLEELLHGNSSGVDIIGVAAESGQYFKQGHITPIKQNWQPYWYLSYCGQTAKTYDCVMKVQHLWKTDNFKAIELDNLMQNSVAKAYSALESCNVAPALNLLAEAVNQAGDCFRQWGLVNASLHEHMQLLLNYGAIAVKPTGSGEGGYVLSLWSNQPTNIPINLLSIET